MISLFGIPNCNTVKKARAFLEKNNSAYMFIDFKKCPPTKEQINVWSDFFGALPINKKGTTYRKNKDYYEILSVAEKINFIIANPSLIKRPILVQNEKIMAFGFSEEQYKELMSCQ